MKENKDNTGSAVSTAVGEPVATADYVLMPRRLTAENGAKGALSGEFKESVEVTCPVCDGSGDDPDFDGDPEDGGACLECGGHGTVTQGVPVSWDTIKDIYKAAVALLAAPTQVSAPQANAAQEVRAVPEAIYQVIYGSGWIDVEKLEFDLYNEHSDGSIKTRIVYSAPTSTSTAPAAMDEGKWISVDERLPEVPVNDYKEFIVSCARKNGNTYVFASYYLNGKRLQSRWPDDDEPEEGLPVSGWCFESEIDGDNVFDLVCEPGDAITHWMPLPAAPISQPSPDEVTGAGKGEGDE